MIISVENKREGGKYHQARTNSPQSRPKVAPPPYLLLVYRQGLGREEVRAWKHFAPALEALWPSLGETLPRRVRAGPAPAPR